MTNFSNPQAYSDASADEAAIAQARAYLDQVRRKMERLAEDFAAGRVNSRQFQELYAHYQGERRMIEKALEESPQAALLRAQGTKGKSLAIRLQHAARILGYAIYSNATGQPIRTVGDFKVDPQLIEPVLESARAGEAEGQMRSVEVEDEQWIGMFPRRYTTLVTLFSLEPARTQLEMLRDLQSHFELANREWLAKGVADPDQLVFPHTVVFSVRSK
jgi:hypothetical protein